MNSNRYDRGPEIIDDDLFDDDGNRRRIKNSNTRDRRNNQNKNQNKNQKKNQKKTIRVDRFIGKVTLITMLIFGMIIFCDVKGIGKNSGAKKTAENIQTTAAEVPTAKQQTSSATTGKYKADNRIVCIDPGHGGTDEGSQYSGYVEKKQTLEISNLVKKYLEAEKITVVMTRNSDTTVSNEERVKIAEAANAGILVSIHRNSYQGGNAGASAKGAEAWIHTASPAGAKSLAGSILNKLAATNSITNRGIKTGTISSATANYPINLSKCTSCELELGFITNQGDNAFVANSMDQCAKAVAQGIINYINEVEKQ